MSHCRKTLWWHDSCRIQYVVDGVVASNLRINSTMSWKKGATPRYLACHSRPHFHGPCHVASETMAILDKLQSSSKSS